MTHGKLSAGRPSGHGLKLVSWPKHVTILTFLFRQTQSNLVCDGRLVVDAAFRTTDPHILAAGTAAKFSRRYSDLDVKTAFVATQPVSASSCSTAAKV